MTTTTTRETTTTTTTTDAPAPPPPAPVHGRHRLRIGPPSAWAALDPRELWHFRELLWNLAVRDVKLRYRQTLLGVLWILLQPLLGAAIFAFVFGRVGGFRTPGDVPYFLFALAGMTCWNVFSSTLNRTSSSMVGNAHLLSKVYFPRLILPLANVFSTMIDFGVTLAFLLVLIGFRWHYPGVNILLMPLCVLIMVLLSLGIGLWATALSVAYRDVQYLVPVVTQLLFYLSPAAYPAAKVSETVSAGHRGLYFLNPLAGVLEAFRWSVLSVGEVRWGYLAYSLVVSLVVLAIGAYTFSRMERRFADVV
jgi:lipopolysaccharide transport system permease protein